MMQNGMPFGDAFLVDTPKLDALGNRLYAEERQRKMQHQKDLNSLDDEFSKSVYKIRTADKDEYVKAYNDWKEDNKKLYEKGERATIDDRENNIRKRAEMYKIGQRSIDLDNWLKAQAKQGAVNKGGMYVDDIAQRLVSANSVPASKFNTDEFAKSILYPYSVPDFEKYNNAAIGVQTDKRSDWVAPGKPGHSGTDILSDESRLYKVYNNPNKQYDVLLNTLVANNKGRNAQGIIYNSFQSDAEIEDLKNKYYARIKDPKYIEAYGETQPFPQSSQTELGGAVALQVMKNVVNAPIPEPKVEKRVNQGISLANKQEFAKEQQARAAANSLMRLREYANIQANKPLSPEDISRGADNLIVQHIKDAQNNNGELLVDANTFEALTGKTKSANSYLTITPEGEYKYGIKDVKTGQVSGVLTPVPYTLAKTKLIKEYPKISAVNSGGQESPRLPKGIKSTKMTKKPSWAN